MIEQGVKFNLTIRPVNYYGVTKFKARGKNKKVPTEVIITILSAYLEELKQKYQESFRAGLLNS